jgi:LacI family transcriptional regulator
MGASMKDVARLANVSTATVSHVINKTRNVNPDTQEKVLKAISDLKYNVNPVARNLRSGSSRIIGYVVSNLANYFFMDIAVTIDESLSENGYHLIFINSNEDPEKERDNIESLLMQNVDGLIIAPVGRDCSYLKNLIGDRCPCVFFDRKPVGYDRDIIMSTNFEGAFDATVHLIEKGYKKIGFIGSRFDETMHEREAGYRDALLRHGIDADDDLIKSGRGRPRTMNEQKSGDAYSFTRYLVEETQVDAILAGNALATVGIVSYLNENSYTMPDDVGFITFDNTFWLTMTSPNISAVNQNKVAIGQQVTQTLLERIKGSDKPITEYRIPTSLILRDSC